MTDFHAARYGTKCIVARFNGGAQAGHTVVLPDGRRHVHSHFGSGTLSGAATFLSRHFVSNPLLFRREKIELEKLGIVAPVVFADERGMVTTPYDMLVNQWAETARGSGKHGSCGVGFGETIERNLDERFAIRISDLANAGKLKTTLDDIRRKWTLARLEKLNVLNLSQNQKDLLAADKLRDEFIAAANEFHTSLKTARPEVLKTAMGIVFEGAQGLLLDEDYGWFPNVTRSHTGLKNAVELAVEAGIKHLDCVYTTRAYATRHGAGYLPYELPAKPYAKIEDATNLPNPHQDSLRFGWLDLDLLSTTIAADYERYAPASSVKIIKQLAITCLDQIDAQSSFVSGGKLRETRVEEFLQTAVQSANVSRVLTSYGMTRETVNMFQLQSRQN